MVKKTSREIRGLVCDEKYSRQISMDQLMNRMIGKSWTENTNEMNVTLVRYTPANANTTDVSNIMEMEKCCYTIFNRCPQ